MEGNNNNIFSIVIVSNDKLSKKIKVSKSTKIENFYQQIINLFPQSENLNIKLFYYEGYSHQIYLIEKEEDYITANKKGIEYFYLCSNDSDYSSINEDMNNYNYLKYYSVIIFSPIKMLNSVFQNIQRKKMQISKNNSSNINNYKKSFSMPIKNVNNNLNFIVNNNIMNNNLFNPMMMNNNMMNPMMMYNNMMNPMMMNNNMMNNNMMNNNMMNNNMMNNNMMNNNMMNNNMMNNNMMNNNMMNNNMMNNNMGMNNNMMMQAMMNNIMNNQLLTIMANMINNKNNFQNPQTNNNNFNNNNSSTNNEEDNNLSSDNGQVSLIFKRTDKRTKEESFKITIVCNKKDLIKDVIKNYCFKTNEKKENLLFLINSKQLDGNKTVEEEHLLSGTIILVVDTKPMKGGLNY